MNAGTAPVLIAYDGTAEGDDALALGHRLAEATGQRPVVAVAHPESPPGTGHVDAEWIEVLREQAADTLERARARLGTAGAADDADYRSVASSSAAHGINDLAEELGASAIVVGSGRDGPLRRILAGSTGERLLHGASVPVVVTPRGHREHSKPGLAVVGCAFVDAPDGGEALRVAAELAGRAGARLRVYSVVAHSSEFALHGGRDAQRAYVEYARDTFAAVLEAAVAALPAGLEASTELLEGDVVSELAALDERDVDILVVGSRGYGPLRRVLLGGTSSRLVRRAASPVMVVPRA